MPSLLKSVARHVGLLLSNISTPFCISCTMMTLVSSKRVSRLSVHLNTEFGFRRLRKGFILSADANAYATWLINPNQLLTSVILRGLGNSLIASMTCGHGRTDVGVISKPVKATVSFANSNLDGLRMMPFRPQMSNHSAAWKKLSLIDPDHMMVSSITFVLFLMSLTISSNRRVYASPEAM